MHLSLTRRRLKVVQRSDVSTHAPIVHCSRSDTRYSTIVLRVAKRRTSRALLGPPPLCSVGLTELTPEAKTLESSPAQDRTHPQTRPKPSGVSSASPTERPQSERT